MYTIVRTQRSKSRQAATMTLAAALVAFLCVCPEGRAQATQVGDGGLMGGGSEKVERTSFLGRIASGGASYDALYWFDADPLLAVPNRAFVSVSGGTTVALEDLRPEYGAVEGDRVALFRANLAGDLLASDGEVLRAKGQGLLFSSVRDIDLSVRSTSAAGQVETWHAVALFTFVDPRHRAVGEHSWTGMMDSIQRDSTTPAGADFGWRIRWSWIGDLPPDGLALLFGITTDYGRIHHSTCNWAGQARRIGNIRRRRAIRCNQVGC
jgi:hypothetical protein